MIRIRSLEFGYPRSGFQLAIPDFKVEESEKVAVIGASGSGKTTLLKLIAGIVLPERGEVSVGEKKVNELGDKDRRDFRITNIGFIFQDFELLDYLNVLDNILHTYRITGALKLDSHVCANAAALADGMGIADKLKQYADELSQGEKQRVAICRALLPRPRLILSDEATGNLDPANKTRILDLLFRQAEEHDATVLAVTHDHDLLDRFDRVIDFQTFRRQDAA